MPNVYYRTSKRTGVSFGWVGFIVFLVFGLAFFAAVGFVLLGLLAFIVVVKLMTMIQQRKLRRLQAELARRKPMPQAKYSNRR